jgi:hypothetical protein
MSITAFNPLQGVRRQFLIAAEILGLDLQIYGLLNESFQRNPDAVHVRHRGLSLGVAVAAPFGFLEALFKILKIGSVEKVRDLRRRCDRGYYYIHVFYLWSDGADFFIYGRPDCNR